ncbi:unnamed protein product [Mucor circinelloides]
MLSSELRGVLLSCNGVNGVPSCSDYIAPAYRICILPGAKPSDSFILSNDYLAQQYEQYTSQIWIDFVAAVLFFVLFTALTALCMEYVDLKQEGTITKLYKKDTYPQVESTEAQLKQEKTRQETSMNWKQYLTELLSLDTNRQLLNNVADIVKSGNFTALIDSSGPSKTTLLDVLDNRKIIGTIEGNIYMNDVHNPNEAMYKALQFPAYLCQFADVSKEEKNACVEQSKLLFLDEPISGLNAQSSYNIARFILKLADACWSVLCTIHQPSVTLFGHFDHFLLLRRGGNTAYFGETGKDSRTMIDYFEFNSGPTCSPEANPAENILECVGAGTAGKVITDWTQVWLNSPKATALEDEMETIHNSIDHTVNCRVEKYAQLFWPQLYYVFKRINISWWRSPSYNVERLSNAVFMQKGHKASLLKRTTIKTICQLPTSVYNET